MDATKVLRNEHEFILKVLDATDEVARRLKAGTPVTPETLDGLLEFFRLFADRCHHGKEEDLLFPLLENKGVPRDGGPVGVMLAEHDEGRALIRNMGDTARQYPTAPAEAGPRWAADAAAYSMLLRQHIGKENDILFVIAERLLTPDEQAKLGEDFERIELEKMGAGTHARLHAQMEQLLQQISKSKAANS